MHRLTRLIIKNAILAGIFIASMLTWTQVRAADLREAVDPALARVARRWEVSARIIEVASGRVLYSLGADEPLIPASVNKVVTSVAALESLGADAEFVTRIYARGAVREGRLEGDIIIRGGGDPNISGRFYNGDAMELVRKWVAIVAASGIRTVSGGVIADDTIFDRQYLHPEWPADQQMRWYTAQVSGLAFNDNCADIYIRSEKNNGSLTFTVQSVPDVPEAISLLPGLVVSPKEKSPMLNLTRPLDQNAISVRGRMPAREGTFGPFYITLNNVPLVFAELFKQELKRNSVEVLGAASVAEARPDYSASDMKILLEHSSTLSQTIWVMNKHSQNFYAECVLKYLGAVKGGEGSFSAGAGVVEKVLAKMEVPLDGVRYVDGSGLAKTNRITATALTELLRRAALRDYAGQFVETLSASGEQEGTLRRRLTQPAYEGRIRAKTGTIKNVSTLAGYAVTADERPRLAFAMLMNKLSGPGDARAVQDTVCRAMVDWVDRQGYKIEISQSQINTRIKPSSKESSEGGEEPAD